MATRVIEARWRSPSRFASLVLAALALGYLAVCWLTSARAAIDVYDGAHHAVLARNLALEGRYGLWDYGRYVLFPTDFSVGPTFILPMALAIRIAGWGPFVPNVACALVCLGLLTAILLHLAGAARGAGEAASAMVALALLVTVTLKEDAYFYLPYGEATAGLLLVLATVAALGRGAERSFLRVGLGGVLAALAADVKLLALIPGVALATTVALLPGSRGPRLVAFATGWLAVSLATATFTLLQLGSWEAYLESWRRFVFEVRHHEASGFGSVIGSRLVEHARVLTRHLGWFTAPLSLAFLPWPALALRAFRRPDDVEARVATALGLQVGVLLAWWLLLCGRPWLRYALIALIALPLYAHLALVACLRGDGRPGPRRALAAAWIGLVAAAVAFGPRSWVVPRPAVAPDPRTAMLFETAERIREIQAIDASAVFWGAGWWRHWDVQLLADIRLRDILVGPVPVGGAGRNYLIVSDLVVLEANPRKAEAIRRRMTHPVFRNAHFGIYLLDPPERPAHG